MNRFLYLRAIFVLLIFFLHSCSLFNESASSSASSTAIIKELHRDEYRTTGMLVLDDSGKEIEYKYFGLHKKSYYNDAGLLTQVSDHSDPTNIFDETINTYDINNNLIKTQYSSQKGQIDIIYKMKYNELNQLVLKSTTSAFSINETTQYIYNKEGKLIQEIRISEGIPTVSIKYLYNKHGNLRSERHFSENELQLIYLHFYDKNGNRIETRKAVGVEQEVFLTTVFDYNNQQKIISQKCSPKGEPPCFSDQYWEYNSKGFLTRVYEKIDDKLFADKQYHWE